MAKTHTKFSAGAVILPLTILFVLVFFGSCASAKSRDKQLFVYLTDTARYNLLPAGDIEKPMDMAQYISVSFQNQNLIFSSWVKADETGIEMNLLSELGTNMGEIAYRDGAIFFSSPVLPAALKPEFIIADFQLCFYNPLLLSRALENCGLVLETGGAFRRILKGKTLIYEIEKNSGEVKLTNHLRGYSYILQGDFS